MSQVSTGGSIQDYRIIIMDRKQGKEFEKKYLEELKKKIQSVRLTLVNEKEKILTQIKENDYYEYLKRLEIYLDIASLDSLKGNTFEVKFSTRKSYIFSELAKVEYEINKAIEIIC